MKTGSNVVVLALSFAGCLTATCLGGCNGSSGGDSPNQEGRTGSATLLLSATSASGKVFRLRSAIFDLEGPETKEIDGPLDPTNPQATATASLVPGSYRIALRPGWRMFEVPTAGAPVEVEAALVSPNPVTAEIASGEDSAINFQFQVGGEIVSPGTVTIGISVTQLDGGLAPDASPAPDMPPVPVIVPDTSHVVDEGTRAVLTAFDQTSGTLRFSQSTALLAALAPGDVLVSAPSSAAPSGYLRKITAIRTDGADVVLETSQANLTDAVSQGVL